MTYGQTTQWPTEKGQKGQTMIYITLYTENWRSGNTNPTKTGGKLRYSERVSSSCSTKMSRRSVAATKSQNCRPCPTIYYLSSQQSLSGLSHLSINSLSFLNIVEFVRWMLHNQHSIKPIWKWFSKAIQQNVKLTWCHYYPPEPSSPIKKKQPYQLEFLT